MTIFISGFNYKNKFKLKILIVNEIPDVHLSRRPSFRLGLSKNNGLFDVAKSHQKYQNECAQLRKL